MPLLRKEFLSFFTSASGIITFLLMIGTTSALVWLFPTPWNLLTYGTASLTPFFSMIPFILSIFAPAVTMRSFAEERKTGTIEILLTLPMPRFRIVLEKFAGYFLILVFYLLATIPFPITLYLIALPQGNIDTAAIITSYMGMLFVAGCFTATGIFASTLTDNVLSSLIIGVLLSLFLYYGIEMIAQFMPTSSLRYYLSYLSIYHHINSISRGVIDTADVAYFLAVIFVFIYLAWRNI